MQWLPSDSRVLKEWATTVGERISTFSPTLSRSGEGLRASLPSELSTDGRRGGKWLDVARTGTFEADRLRGSDSGRIRGAGTSGDFTTGGTAGDFIDCELRNPENDDAFGVLGAL